RELDGLAEAEAAAVGSLLAGDHPEQRRLAGAVRADHADDPAGRQGEVEILDQQPIAEALAQPGRLDHDVAQAISRGDVDLDAIDLDVRLLRQERLVPLQPRLALGLARLLRQACPFHLARERATACRLALLLQREPRLLLLEPARVVALIRNALAA